MASCQQLEETHIVQILTMYEQASITTITTGQCHRRFRRSQEGRLSALTHTALLGDGTRTVHDTTGMIERHSINFASHNDGMTEALCKHQKPLLQALFATTTAFHHSWVQTLSEKVLPDTTSQTATE